MEPSASTKSLPAQEVGDDNLLYHEGDDVHRSEAGTAGHCPAEEVERRERERGGLPRQGGTDGHSADSQACGRIARSSLPADDQCG